MPFPKSASPKIMRAAGALKIGYPLLKTLRAPETRDLLKTSVPEHIPAVSKISQRLLDEHGKEVKLMPVRQFIGSVVRAIMEEEGYEVAETGVRIPHDPVFTTGAVYRKTDTPQLAKTGDLLERFIAALSQEELGRVIVLAEAALKKAA